MPWLVHVHTRVLGHMTTPTCMYTEPCLYCVFGVFLMPPPPGVVGLISFCKASVRNSSWLPTSQSVCTQLVGLAVNQLFSVTAAR